MHCNQLSQPVLLYEAQFPSTSPLPLCIRLSKSDNPPRGGAACASGLHIIAARASGEAPGSGRIGAVASSIIARVPGSDVTSVDYPATIDNVQNYAASEHQGTLAMTKLVQDYVAACPRTKISLLGYSQGTGGRRRRAVPDELGHFAQDGAVGGGVRGQRLCGCVDGVAAHVAGQSYNRGTSTRSGVFVRRNTAPCQAYADRWQDYCDTNDYYCDSAPLELDPGKAVHAGYVARYGTAATDFVVSRAAAAGLPTRTAAPVTPNKGLLELRILGL